MHDEPKMIFSTVPNREVGSTIAKKLLEEHLAACVNIVPGLTSLYRWEGEIHEDSEELLIIKTTTRHAQEAIALIADLHPYDTPEAIAFTITAGHPPYLRWINSSVGPE